MRYVNEFLSYHCASDILQVVNPLGNKPVKEITEAMGIIHPLRKIVLSAPMEYGLIDIGAGNALGSVTAVHLLPVKWAVAVDKKERTRRWHLAKRFEYTVDTLTQKTDLSKYAPDDSKFITMGIHTCSSLALNIIEAWKKCNKSPYLLMIPCCEVPTVRMKMMPGLLKDKLSSYEQWATSLFLLAGGQGKMYSNNHILSPKNIVIIAKKKEE